MVFRTDTSSMHPGADEAGVTPRVTAQVLERLPEKLARQRRYRRTVEYLVDADGSEHTSTVVRRLAAAERRTGEVDTEHYREVYSWFHGTAIPTLCQFAAVDYDEDQGELTLGALDP